MFWILKKQCRVNPEIQYFPPVGYYHKMLITKICSLTKSGPLRTHAITKDMSIAKTKPLVYRGYKTWRLSFPWPQPHSWSETWSQSEPEPRPYYGHGNSHGHSHSHSHIVLFKPQNSFATNFFLIFLWCDSM